jgi:tRNA threonylcarbamoyladenosine biosynthesis protein TsaB
MKILAIDTSTKFLCLGIYDDAKIYEYTLETGRQLSSLLDITVKRVIDMLDWRVSDIDYFACGLGPGSFTGIRTGVSFIKGMSWAVNKPVIGISTLDILAANAGNTAQQIIPIVDAKRNLIYCSVYKKKDSRLIKIKPYMLLSREEAARYIKKEAVILGDALCLYKEYILANINGVTLLDRDYWYPKPRNIIKIALERIKDKKFNNPFDIKPLYLYPKECQIKVSNSHE